MISQVVSDVAAGVAALAALATVGVTVRYGRDTARNLQAAASSQQRSAELLSRVVETMERTVVLVDAAARSAELARQREEERRAMEAVPRLTIQAPEPGNQVDIGVTAVNVGGDAVPAFVLVATPNGNLYGGTWEIPGHTGVLRGSMKRIGTKPVSQKVIYAVARDANGVWWDQRTWERVDDPRLDAVPRAEAMFDWARRLVGTVGNAAPVAAS